MTSPEPFADRHLGEIVAGKYRLDRVLASGGMGRVYGAEHLRLGRPVAIKLLHRDRQRDEAWVKRFQQEARKAASLVHGGIVEVRDFGWAPAVGPYLEMELLDGASVQQILGTHGRLPLDVAVQITLETLDALAAAHARGMVHRDVKPNNLFVALLSGGEVRTKVLDFGIAKMFTSALDHGDVDGDEGTFSEALTKTGMVLGTLNYMSPEQFADARHVTHVSDVYSVGASLYEMLTNQPVVAGETVYRCVSRVMAGEIRRHPAIDRQDVPAWLDAIVARALSLLPGDRFESAYAMRSAIEAGISLDLPAVRQAMIGLATEARAQARGRASDAVTAGASPAGLAGRAVGPDIEDTTLGGPTPDTEDPTVSEPARDAEDTTPGDPTRDTARTFPPVEVRSSPGPAGRGPTLSTALFVVVALVVGAGGATLYRELSGSEPGVQPVASAPRTGPPAGEVLEPTPVAPHPVETEPAPQPAAAPDRREAETDDVSDGPPAEVRRSSPRRARGGAPGGLRHDGADGPATEPGLLTINTIPSARLLVDGQDTGRSTPISGLPVEPGLRRLELRLPDGTTHDYPIQVEPGQTVRLFRVLPR